MFQVPRLLLVGDFFIGGCLDIGPFCRESLLEICVGHDGALEANALRGFDVRATDMLTHVLNTDILT